MIFNLSEITELIQHRRTIYPEFYTDRKVHKEMVEKMINNAIWAPTHGNTQPWRFKVFMDDSREQLANHLGDCYKKFVPEEKFDPQKLEKIKNRPTMASVVIAICMERDKREKIPEIEEVEAVACAVQNLSLTCAAYGLGGFWSTPKFIYTDMMHDFLGLNEKDKCLGLFYIGYPKKDFDWPKGQRKPLEYVTEWMD